MTYFSIIFSHIRTGLLEDNPDIIAVMVGQGPEPRHCQVPSNDMTVGLPCIAVKNRPNWTPQCLQLPALLSTTPSVALDWSK